MKSALPVTLAALVTLAGAAFAAPPAYKVVNRIKVGGAGR
jgi:hypothetical protein